MSKHLRRRFRSASLRGVALAALLSASLVGAVGCAGGSNPFCGNSKEKCEVEEGLKRAQEIDEDLKNESEAKVEEAGRSVGILRTDGSGNASVAESAPTKRKTFDDEPSSPQKMLETASASDVAPDALNDAQVSVPEEKSESGVDDALLPAPAVPSNPAPAPTPVEAAPSVEPTSVPAPAESARPTNEPNAEPAPTDDSLVSPEQPVETPAEPSQTDASAGEEQKTPEARPEETTVARSARRGGPQRAASRRVAQRGSTQTLAVPQTRGVASVPATSIPSPVPGPPTVVKTRVRAVVL